jgi:hypothetical protein
MDLTDLGHWNKSIDLYEFGDKEKDLFGLVYKIVLPNGFWYIGSKQFHSKKKLKPLKGKTRCRRTFVESDWKTYSSSSNLINEYIAKNGKDGIIFEIICLVRGGKFELKYCEMKEQVSKNCLFDVNCLNGIINVRLGKKKDINIENFLKKVT